MPANFASSLILSTTAYLGKAFLRFGTKDLRVDGLPILLKALEENPQSQISNVQKDAQDGQSGQPRRRGVVTICNHNSVVDDPFMWSILPIQNFLPFALPAHTSRHSRWTLGARDIMFTNPVFSKFFTSGQVINTERGGGIFQPAIDEAVKRLQDGEWIHIFPEAKVNQRKTNPDGGILRFKWGIGRIIMDSETMPEIIPMWISGFDQIMPETRGFPRFVPRTGARISITVGEPLTTQIQPLVDKWRGLARQESGTVGVGGEWEAEGNSPPGEKQRDIRESGYLSEGQEEAVRIQITSALQDGLQKLGQSVEEAEGRIASGEWCHSISKSQRGLVE